MGIYHNGIIFGIKYVSVSGKNFFEKTSDTKMNLDQVENFKKKYNELTNKDDYNFQVYMSTQKTYSEPDSTYAYMYWWSIRKETLEKWMNHDDSYKNDL
jgi:hypothetical protein